eukprot:136421_1
MATFPLKLIILHLCLGLVIVTNGGINAYPFMYPWPQCDHLIKVKNRHMSVRKNYWPNCRIRCGLEKSCSELFTDKYYGPDKEYAYEKSESCGKKQKHKQYWCYKIPPIKAALKTEQPAEIGGSYWMSFLPNHKKINEINLAGTHDSAAYGTFTGKMTQTQNHNIDHQLNMGVRMLDLRIRYIPHENKFVLAHGPASFDYISFAEVMDTIVDFLRFHDTETIIVSFWPEKFSFRIGQTKKVTTKAFKKWFEKPNNKYKKYFHKFTWLDGKKRVPRLGEVRGKIIMMEIEMDKKGFDKIGKYALVYGKGKDIEIPDTMWDKHAWQKPDLFREWMRKVKEYNKKKPGKKGNRKYYGLSSGANGGLRLQFEKDPKAFADHMNPKMKQILFGGYDKQFSSHGLAKKPIFTGWLAYDFIDYQLAQFTAMSNEEIWEKVKIDCKGMYQDLSEASGEFYNEKQWKSRVLRKYTGSCEGKKEVKDSNVFSLGIWMIVIGGICSVLLIFLVIG